MNANGMSKGCVDQVSIIPLEEKGFPRGKEHYQFFATRGCLTCNHEVLMTNMFSQSPTE